MSNEIAILTHEGVKHVDASRCGLNKTLVFLKKFTEGRLTTGIENPDIVHVRNIDAFFKEFTENGYFVFNIEFEDGTCEEISIGNMADFFLDEILKKSKFAFDIQNRLLLLDLIKKLKPARIRTKINELKDFLEQSVLNYPETGINGSSTKSSNHFLFNPDSDLNRTLLEMYVQIIEILPEFAKCKFSFNKAIVKNGADAVFNEQQYFFERQCFQNVLVELKHIFSNAEPSIYSCIEMCDMRKSAADALMKDKCLKVLDAIRRTEETCHYVNSYFLNACTKDSWAFEYLSIVQVEEYDMYNHDGKALDIAESIIRNFANRWDFNVAYSLLVVPELGFNISLLKRWSRMSSNYHVFLITDYPDLRNYNFGHVPHVEREWEKLHPDPFEFVGAGSGEEKCFVTINHSIFRLSYDDLVDSQSICIPNSMAFVGVICSLPINQVPRGRIIGAIDSSIDFLDAEIEMITAGCCTELYPNVGFQFITTCKKGDGVYFYGASNLLHLQNDSLAYRLLPFIRMNDWFSKNIAFYIISFDLFLFSVKPLKADMLIWLAINSSEMDKDDVYYIVNERTYRDILEYLVTLRTDLNLFNCYLTPFLRTDTDVLMINSNERNFRIFKVEFDYIELMELDIVIFLQERSPNKKFIKIHSAIDKIRIY